MKKTYIIRTFFTGIIVSQIVFTLHVYISNITLFDKISQIAAAGYLIVPNENIISGMKGIGPAFFGGLFFTLSTGAGLTLLITALIWIWDKFFNRSFYLIIFFVLIFTLWIIQINTNGFNPVITIAYIAIPLSMAVAAKTGMPEKKRGGGFGKKEITSIIPFMLPIILMTGLWLGCMEKNMFLDIRDYLLLSNRAGEKINNFYYKYTLYPAESFKSLSQKTLKTCDLSAVENYSKNRLYRVLKNYDYLDVGCKKRVDLKIIKKDNMFGFENKNSIILKTKCNEFFHDPGKILDDFSKKTDKYSFFRKFTFFSILVGFPTALYLVIYVFFKSVLNIFLNKPLSSVLTSVLCMFLGLSLFLPVFLGQKKIPDYESLDKAGNALFSNKWQTRVSALKQIDRKKTEPIEFSRYYHKVSTLSTVERYWVAKIMGSSKKTETIKYLMELASDPEVLVVCQAFNSLGQRGYKNAVDDIRKKIIESDHWYSQLYGYKTLRKLGWKQTKSE